MKVSGRERDIVILRRTQRAAAAGRLLLGELKSWQDFLQPEMTEYNSFGRRDLKASKSRFRTGVSKEIQKFCRENFEGMTEAKLEKLYLRIKERLGLEMPLGEFEREFSPLKEKTLAGAPRHCTVVVSLWGLQTRYPEDMLSKDIIEAVRLLRVSDKTLKEHSNMNHRAIIERRDEVGAAVRTQEFASRTCLLACFNLVEAALNGIAWDFAQKPNRFENLSQTKKKLIEDGNFRDKLLKYPEIIGSCPLWDENDERVKGVLEQIKPYRDALVHASPFSKPAKYGGLDKLEHIYRIDSDKAQQAASRTAVLLRDLFVHVRGDSETIPGWLTALIQGTVPEEVAGS